MNIGSLSSAYASQSYQPMQQATAVERKEKDRDADDAAVKAAAQPAAPSPTVNSSGQAVGQLINAIA
ncbi:MAG: hypothetical protein RIR00_1946 [Pseudomonadota bacterium]|jgi:hypothetical protein